ncbi:22644_t:CDS:2, partial [Gigaspora rosea]
MGSIKDQLLNIINLSNTTESYDEDQMNIDQDEEINKQLSLYYKIINPEINYNKVLKSHNWLGTISSLWTIETLFGKGEVTILIFLDQLIVAIQSLREEY